MHVLSLLISVMFVQHLAIFVLDCIRLQRVERNRRIPIYLDQDQTRLDQNKINQSSLCTLLKTFFSLQVFQIFLTFLWFILFFVLFLLTLFFTVLAGRTDRFASTHRVCRTDGHTYLSIKHRCLAALQVGMIFIFSCLHSFFSDFHLIFFFYD